MPEIDQSDPAYHEGYQDAFSVEPEPLFPDASPLYRAGWLAGMEAREIVRSVFGL